MSGEQILYNRPLFPARLDMSHPLTKNLVGCWVMNGRGMRVWDSSPYKNHCITSGSPIRSSQEIIFDATDDYTQVGNAQAFNNIGAVSYAAWINLSAGRVTRYHALFSSLDAYHSAGIQYIFAVYGDAGGVFSLAYYNPNAGWKYFTEAGNLSLNKWYFVAFSYDGAIMTVYLNNTSTSIATAAPPAAGNNVIIGGGSWSNNGDDLAGKKGMELYYTRALTIQEVKNLYLNPYDMFLK